MLPLLHHLHSKRAQHKHVHQSCRHGSSQGDEPGSVFWSQELRRAAKLAVLARSQCHDQGEARLEREVDRECG